MYIGARYDFMSDKTPAELLTDIWNVSLVYSHVTYKMADLTRCIQSEVEAVYRITHAVLKRSIQTGEREATSFG